MTILEKIVEKYPELENADLLSLGIWLQDDLDDKGVFILKWDYSKPLPEGLKLGK